MPGSSLWLLPPKSHPLNSILSDSIEQTSSRFDSPHRFIPHVTITSEISASTYSSDPQSWLESLKMPFARTVQVQFEELASENVFVRKLYIKCMKADGLEKLAVVCRQQVEGFEDVNKAEAWASDKYNPHLSLLYHDCPVVGAEEMSKVKDQVTKAGLSLVGEGNLGGWIGGRVVLVPTDKPIDQWTPLAEIQL
jgi:2',3'-cyclic-nucleotide 3'-phosphodiesterase